MINFLVEIGQPTLVVLSSEQYKNKELFTYQVGIYYKIVKKDNNLLIYDCLAVSLKMLV